ncbi:hypothetical protein V2S66_22540 [Streptomyces sp. V4-01]|uniref:Uncharacterized protein n=1 Tax=Actinacidiphila polyblastidii TaxID=3110430 RepID=A0ABU7PFZ2_9ACTN|nr:hypothetical protein [Streptomyces sp. V4-01]
MTTTDWARLSHAYGSAEDIPGLLDLIETAPTDERWNELWSALCHQGSVYSASFAALPRLAAIAAARPGPERVSALVLAGSIMAGAAPRESAAVRGEHAVALADLSALTRAQLAVPTEDVEYVHLTEAGLALEGVPVWGEGDALSWTLTTGEREVGCPACDADLCVVLGGEGRVTTAADRVRPPGGAVPPRPAGPLDPVGPEALDGVGRRLYDAALADGHPRIALALTYFFGAAVCPVCGGEFAVAEAVAGS